MKSEYKCGPRVRGGLYREGRIWWLRYQVRGRRVKKSLYTENLEEAERLRAEIIAEVHAEKQRIILATAARVPPAASIETRILDTLAKLVERVARIEAQLVGPDVAPLSLADAWERFTVRRLVSDGQAAGREAAFRSFSRWMAAQSPAPPAFQSITPDHVARWLQYCREIEHAHPNTIHKRLVCLRTWCKVIGPEAGMQGNPFTAVQTPRVATSGRRALSVDELRRIIGTAPPDLRTLMLIGIYTGARLGDAATLDWSAVDFVGHRCSFVQGKTKRRLVVPLHPALAVHLQALPPPHSGAILPDLADLYRAGSACGLTKRLKRHFESCGVATTATGSGKRKTVVVGFHSLRHSFVSLAAAAGTAPTVLQSLAGHTSEDMTRRYTHTTSEDARRAVAAIPDFIPQPMETAL
jgi:integrase